ncbi:ArsR/SmtB family transcription factor [Agromyces humatus]|uniref:Winged helix-turn-helix domain-containing protein n=1 Tax=Agromyces humatus TaxID=279573 RepID=A0ABN2KB48_9MICO|nr:metalloregulator ArsR/SmtB family transcription factor [Agromyces humatus]
MSEYTGDEMMRIMAALSNPHRMRVVATLVRGATYVSQLARELEISRPLLQVHLRRLEAAGLVTSQLQISEEGKAMKFYSVQPFALQLSPETIARGANSLTLPDAEKGGEHE